MTHQTFTSLPARVDSNLLLAELRALGVGRAFLLPARTETRPDDAVAALPPELKAELPDGVTPEQVRAVLAAHAPDATDDEQAARAADARRLAMKQELRAYLLEFLADPELLAMLRAALRE
ncbi:MAG: hypothetical protein K2X87_09195 [Gemmataceae bacterium]|nr:hypothetical protein [Gemmataceae bacterium]